MSPEQAAARIMNMLPGLSLEERRREILMIVTQAAQASWEEGYDAGCAEGVKGW